MHAWYGSNWQIVLQNPENAVRLISRQKQQTRANRKPVWSQIRYRPRPWVRRSTMWSLT